MTFKSGSILTASQLNSAFSFTQAGQGAAVRTMQDRLQDRIHVLDFGAKGDGVTDDTAAIQAAIAEALALGDTLPVEFTRNAIYLVSSLTLNNYTKLRGNGATLKSSAPGSSTSLLVVPSQNFLQTTKKSIIDGLILDGGNGTLGSATVIGMDVGNHAALTIRDVGIQNCYIGCRIQGAQFCTAYNLKTWNNTVGFYNKVLANAGGGNSWSFYDLQCIGNIIGYVQYNNTVYPNAGVYLRNPTFTGNTIAAAAVIAGAGMAFTQCQIDGSANELNGGSAQTSYVFDGNTIPRCSIYVSNAQLQFDGMVAEPTVTPFIQAANGAEVVVGSIDGYGNPTGQLISCDSTSYCTFNSQVGTIGQIANIARMSGNVGPNAGLLLPAQTYVSPISNGFTNPNAPQPTDTNGCSAAGWGQDATQGQYYTATFPTSTIGAGRFRFTISPSAGQIAIAFNVWASVDCLLQTGLTGNVGNHLHQLRSGRWTRVMTTVSGLAGGSIDFLLSNGDLLGATLKVCKFHLVSGLSTVDMQGAMNSLAVGAFNPNVTALQTFDSQAAAPTVGTWSQGNIVYNSAPAASGAIGWVCTASGTPGTWKSFGAISA